MSDSTVTIGGDTSDLDRKLKQAGSSIRGFGKDAQSSIGSIDLGKALGIAGGVAGLTSLIKKGFEFNQTMQDGEVAIANVLKTFKGLNDEAAKSEAAKAVQAIAAAEPRAAGGLDDLTRGFIASAAAAHQAGISVDQNVDLVARFANALSNSQQPLEQLNQEIRSVLTGQVTSDSFIGKLLEGKGLDNKRIQQLIKEGTLYQVLVKELGALGEAGDTAAVAMSTLDSAMKKTLGLITEGMFDQAVDGAKDLASWLDENKDLFRDVGSGISSATQELVSFLGFLNEVRKTYEDIKENPVVTFLRAASNPVGFGVEKLKGAATAPGEAGAAAAAAGARSLGGAAGSPVDTGVGALPMPKASDNPRRDGATASVKGMTDDLNKVEELRLKLGERQFEALLKHMTPLLQIEAIQKRINEEQQNYNALQATDDGGGTALLEQTEKLLDLEEQLAEAKKKQQQAAEEAATKQAGADKKAAAAAEEALEKVQNAMDLEKQMQILRAKAEGDTQKAETLQREYDIQQAKRQIMEETNASEAQALALAREQVGLKERIAQDQEKARNGKGGKDDEEGKIDARIGPGGAEGARQRAEARRAAGDAKRAGRYDAAFETFDEATAGQKKRFGAAFGPPGTEGPMNPAKVDAAKNEGGSKATDPAASSMTQGLELIRGILETLKGGA